MTISVHWVDLDCKNVKNIELYTPAGVLEIYHYNHVITKTVWCFEGIKELAVDDKWVKQIQSFLNYENQSLAINCQKQGTHFRNKVWAEICKIPAGQVISYSALAQKVDSGARAVANACRDNPFPGIIPCHRVVSVSGLGGYMGETSGKFLEIKKKLLASEAD